MLVIDMSEREFIPSSEKEVEKPVTFIVVPPTRNTILKIQDLLQTSFTGEDFKKQFKFSEYAKILLDDCLVGWKNIVGADGKDIPFSKENTKYLSDLVMLTELTNFIDELGKPKK